MAWTDLLNRREKESSESETDKKKREQDELELKGKLDKVDSLETSVKAFKEKTEPVLTQMSSFLKEQQELKAKREREEREKKNKEAKESQDQELEELALTDPVKAAELIADRKMGPLVAAQINTNSILLRKQIFDDNPGDYEYYQGEFKNEVDKLIDNLDLKHKTNPEAIKNCYAVALFNKQKEIKEGKLKSRFAAASKHSESENKQDKDQITLNDDQKRAARNLGIKEEDYAKMMKEMNYV